MNRRRLIVVAISLIGTCGLAWGQAGRAEESAPSAAADQGAIKDQPGKDQPDKDQSSPPAGPPAQMEGFRQARFGMSEEQVRQAIRKDFPGAAAKLTVAIHPSEKTTVLSLSAQNRTVLLILSGVAASARLEEKKAPKMPPLSLELSYIEDAAHPDIFKISKGQF